MIDPSKIESAVLDLSVSPLAKEEGGALIDAWVSEYGTKDAQFEIAYVELGFIVWLDERTALIGVQDMIAKDKIGYFGNEWKTVKEPRKTMQRGKLVETAWWNEDVWLRQISNGPQLAIYALALNRGTYYEVGGKQGFQINEPSPRIRVRAVVKSSPPRFWPSDPSRVGTYEFTNTALEDAAAAIRNKADQIRCARRNGEKPWQMTGMQCFPFNRECQFFADHCSQNLHPNVTGRLFDASDPAAQLAFPHIPKEKLADPELVVLSYSSYSTACECMEKYRIVSGGLAGGGEKEESYALDTGTVLHAGVAELYRQLRRSQSQSNGD